MMVNNIYQTSQSTCLIGIVTVIGWLQYHGRAVAPKVQQGGYSMPWVLPAPSSLSIINLISGCEGRPSAYHQWLNISPSAFYDNYLSNHSDCSLGPADDWWMVIILLLCALPEVHPPFSHECFALSLQIRVVYCGSGNINNCIYVNGHQHYPTCGPMAN